MDKDRYYINAELNDDAAYKESIDFAIKICKEDESIENVILLARTQSNVDWLERVYGNDLVKKMFKGLKVKDCNATLKIETLKTFKKANTRNSIVITMALDSPDLTEVDDRYDVRTIIAIPWQLNLLEKWIKAWGAVDIRGEKELAIFAEPPCVVRKALDELTININRSSGLTNPHDNRRAKTYVRALYEAGYELDVNQIHAYLVSQHHWESRHAEDLEELIEKLKSGKTFQGGETSGLSAYTDRWKKDCDDQG